MTVPNRVAARLARGLIKTHGDRAGEVAAERAEAMAVYGNEEAAQIWVDVCGLVIRIGWQRAARLARSDSRKAPRLV